MTNSAHRARQHRSADAGIEAVTLVSDRHFPRHAHDQFGIGLLAFGAQRSWSGIGQVEAGEGDIITVNPGEMHDGFPIGGGARGWRMLYFAPSLVAREMGEEAAGRIEIARPALHDPALGELFARVFAGVITPAPDRLDLEESLLRMLMHAFRRYGACPPPASQRAPCVTAALRRLEGAPELPATLSELAALSGVSRFQLLRGFARELGVTPHAYLLQLRVRLARRCLLAGQRPAEAAVAAGFADQSHMTRAFARQLGVTPARYRAAVA